MPSIAQEYQDPISSKKRRREDGEIQMKLSSPRLNRESSHSSLSPAPSRHYIQIKSSKRQRFDLPPPSSHSATSHFLNTPPYEHIHTHDNSRSNSHAREKERIVHDYSPNQEITREKEAVKEKEKEKDKKKDLSPCHVCHRRPTKMQELESFADCEGCGGRTCWICVRECGGGFRDGFRDGEGGREKVVGWGEGGCGHRKVVCSRCCVERGTEGEVWCLGCLKEEGDG